MYRVTIKIFVFSNFKKKKYNIFKGLCNYYDSKFVFEYF